MIKKIGQDGVPGDDFLNVEKQDCQGTKQGLLVIGNQTDKSLDDWKTEKNI